MKLSEYVILGKPLFVDRDFQNEQEEHEVVTRAYADGVEMQRQGFYVLNFFFAGGKLKTRLGEEPTNVSMRLLEEQG